MRVAMLAAVMLSVLPAPVMAQSGASDVSGQVASGSAPAPDPVRLAISRKVAARLVPDGVFQKVMAGTMDTLTSGIMDQVLDMPLKTMVGPFLKDEAVLESLGPGTLREIGAILDPAFKERSELSMRAMVGAMGGLMASMEPEMREGMALAYANRFTAAELADLDRFFASPSGEKFAAENMTIMTDPAIAQRMQSMMPKIIEAMPDIIKKTADATATLPKPRAFADLTAEERARLAKLIGISERDFKDDR